MMPEAEDNIIDNTGEQTEEVTNTAEVDANADADSQKAENDNYYEELLVSDMNELSDEFAENGRIKITDLKNPLRYGALRDLGLTPKEAYLASGGRKERTDNRSHLSSSVPRKTAAEFSEIPRAELDAARELFSDISDSEIRNLYRKVTQ